MSEMKHTPGPWVLTVHTGTGGPINPGDDWSISGHFSGVAIVYEGGRNPNADADARLIAAAPELLEALIALRSLYDTDEGCRATPEYIAATAAIARATGGQP